MLLENIHHYLKDTQYKINLTYNKIYINNYNDILTIEDNNIYLDFTNFYLKINGQNFKVSQLLDHEILILGQIESMEYIYK